MSKIKNEMAARCELALMGKVVPCSNNEVQAMTEYIYSAMGFDPDRLVNILENAIQKYDKSTQVKYIVTNTLRGQFRCITYLLEAEDTPKPFEEDYGSGYPCSFCYVFNTTDDWLSEFGDCFFEKRADGYYHRVS